MKNVANLGLTPFAPVLLHMMTKIKYKSSAAIDPASGTEPIYDAALPESTGLQKIILFIILLDIATAALCFFGSHDPSFLPALAMECFLLFLPFTLIYIGRQQAAAHTLFAILAASILYAGCFFGQSYSYPSMLLFLIALSFHITTRSFPWLHILIVVSIYTSIEWYALQSQWPHPPLSNDLRRIIHWSSFFSGLLLFVYTLILLNADRARLIRYLKEQQQREEETTNLKHQFIGKAYHELRSSFFCTFSLVKLLYRTQTNEGVKQIVGNLDASFQLSRSIMDNIMEFERFQSGINIVVHQEPTDVKELAQHLADTYQYAAEEKDVRIILGHQTDFPDEVTTDRVKLQQIIANLLSNAIKFSSNHSNIIIELTRPYGNTWQLCVENQGDGIPDADQSRIFDPFFTTNPQGIGLGLYIVRKLVLSLEGKITAFSGPGQGARFLVTLPLQSQLITNSVYP